MNLEPEALIKSEWALQRGGRSAHSFSWLLSSPQQPLETEDPPTVSLAPQYTSQPLCRAIEIFFQSEFQQNTHFSSAFIRFTRFVGATISPSPLQDFLPHTPPVLSPHTCLPPV